MAEYTVFTKVKANEFNGAFAGNVTGNVTGSLIGTAKATTGISKADSYSLTAAEKTLYIGATMTAASKVLTLGLANGQVAIVMNEGGTNAFTVKNVSGDSGTSLAAGKVALVVASTTANSTTVTVLN